MRTRIAAIVFIAAAALGAAAPAAAAVPSGAPAAAAGHSLPWGD